MIYEFSVFIIFFNQFLSFLHLACSFLHLIVDCILYYTLLNLKVCHNWYCFNYFFLEIFSFLVFTNIFLCICILSRAYKRRLKMLIISFVYCSVYYLNSFTFSNMHSNYSYMKTSITYFFYLCCSTVFSLKVVIIITAGTYITI